MATTLTATGITFTDASVQDTGGITYLDTQGGSLATTSATPSVTYPSSYQVGHYLLIENQSKGSFTVACPLNGWDSSVYAAPVLVASQTFSTPTNSSFVSNGGGTGVAICNQRSAVGSGATVMSGTWKSRGGNLVCFLVQRVA